MGLVSHAGPRHAVKNRCRSWHNRWLSARRKALPRLERTVHLFEPSPYGPSLSRSLGNKTASERPSGDPGGLRYIFVGLFRMNESLILEETWWKIYSTVHPRKVRRLRHATSRTISAGLCGSCPGSARQSCCSGQCLTTNLANVVQALSQEYFPRRYSH